MMIRAVLYPGAHIFSTAGGKEQATQILVEKVNDICDKIPSFKREINWARGFTREGKDSCKYVFKNGSIIENLAARETSRGRRFHAKIFYESGQLLSRRKCYFRKNYKDLVSNYKDRHPDK